LKVIFLGLVKEFDESFEVGSLLHDVEVKQLLLGNILGEVSDQFSKSEINSIGVQVVKHVSFHELLRMLEPKLQNVTWDLQQVENSHPEGFIHDFEVIVCFGQAEGLGVDQDLTVG